MSNKAEILRYLLIGLLFLTCSSIQILSQKAFPDAIGFGAKCKGAYAGSKTPKILIVDDITAASVGNEETGRGSFTWAITRNYPRIILFEVSGNIKLNSKLSINNPYVTIAGQTAPHPGISITNYPFVIYTSNVIIQHLRFRLGDLSIGDGTFDAFSIYNGPNTYIDHCSFSWAVDENISCSSTDKVKNVTISNCIISEALYDVPHPDGRNSYGMLIYKGDSISIMRNIFVHLGARAPMVNNTANNVLIANNLLYNTGITNSNIYFNTNAVQLKASVIGNKIIRGSQSLGVKLIQVKSDLVAGTKIYLEDNEDISRTSSPWSVVTGDTTHFRSNTQSLRDIHYTPISSADLETSLLPTVGARPKFRDQVDSRIINELETKTGRMIDSQNDVGGFPNLANNVRILEIPANPHADSDNDQYTNLEEWLYQFHLELLGVTAAANNAPSISDQSFAIDNSLQNGSRIGYIKASDSDPNQTLTYFILTGNPQDRYVIREGTGELILNQQVNSNVEVIDQIEVQVKDNGPGNLTASASVTITIRPNQQTVLNTPPVINNQSFTADGSSVGNQFIGRIAATDGENDPLLFSLTNDASSKYFILDALSGDLSKSASFSTLKKDTVLNFTVIVKDDGDPEMDNSATISVSCHVSSFRVYIDPENTGDPLENGSITHPFDSWNDVQWEKGNWYMQKRNTTSHEDKIFILADDVVLTAYGEGKAPVINSYASDFVFQAFSKENITISGLHLLAPDAISSMYFLNCGSDSIIIDNCTTEGSDRGVQMVDGNNLKIRYSTFKNSEEALYLIGGYAEIYYNVFLDNETAVNLGSQASTAHLFNNVFYGNSQGVAATYASFSMFNNIFYLDSENDVAINTVLDEYISDHNLFYPEQAGFVKIAGKLVNTLDQLQTSFSKEIHSLINDPLFRRSESGDFRVSAVSPAIDAGRSIHVKKDFYGSIVPAGDAPDIGIEEKAITMNRGSIADTINTETLLQVYPNPSNGQFNLALKFDSPENIHYEILSSTGNRLVVESIEPQEPNTLLNINLANQFQKGVYFLVLRTGQLLMTKKLVIY